MYKLYLFQGSEKYAEAIWNWRNDPISREYSFCNKLIPWEEHINWYIKVLNDPKSKVFIGEIAKKPIGIIRFQKLEGNPNIYKVNINIEPLSRGRRIGSELLKLGIQKLRNSDNKFNRIIAEIKIQNEASIRLFKNFGFERISRDSIKFCYYYDIN